MQVDDGEPRFREFLDPQASMKLPVTDNDVQLFKLAPSGPKAGSTVEALDRFQRTKGFRALPGSGKRLFLEGRRQRRCSEHIRQDDREGAMGKSVYDIPPSGVAWFQHEQFAAFGGNIDWITH